MSTCLSAEDALQNANREFLDKNYKTALEMYDLSVELDNSNPDAFLKRAACQEKMKNYKGVVADANEAIKLDPMNVKAYYQKGVTSFELGDYQTAQESFEKCLALDRKDSIYPTWIEKCTSPGTSKAKPSPPSSTSTTSTPKPTSTSTSSSTSSDSDSARSAQPKRPAQPPQPPAPKAPKAPRAPKAGTQPSTPTPQPVQPPAKPAEPAPAAPSHPLPPPSSSRYTWYQTDNFVVVTVFAKAAIPSDVSVEFEEKSLNVSIKLSADNQFLLDLDLAHEITPSTSTFEIMSTKVEIKLKKAQPVKWATLERKEELAPPPKKEKKNWDKILANEEEDKDTSFNQTMRDMYSCATEEERRAMMKSFHESGGTVLSADWKDVGKGVVEPKPPVGVTKWEKDAI